MSARIIETPFGSTFVKQIGKGPKVFVIHGGPAFEHSYLVDALDVLSSRRTLVFYDQPGSGRSTSQNPNLSPALIYEHFRWLSHHLSEGKPVGVIAHSFGGLVFIGAHLSKELQQEPIAEFSESLIINPVPVTGAKYMACAKNLARRIGMLSKLKLLWLAISQSDGTKIMDFLLPYYAVDKSAVIGRQLPLNKKTYLKVSGGLKDFDYSGEIHKLPPVSGVIGRHDFITTDLIEELAPHFTELHMMENAAHFPFWESRAEFEEILLTNFKE